MADQLRITATERIPLIDTLITASARAANALLVHKDPHFTTIPGDLVKQLYLGD